MERGEKVRLPEAADQAAAGTITPEGIQSYLDALSGRGRSRGMAQIYGATEVVERHRHRYEVNQAFDKYINQGGLEITGTSPDGKLVEFVEAPNCHFFVATQAHPEFRSRPTRPHPLFSAFIKSLMK